MLYIEHLHLSRERDVIAGENLQLRRWRLVWHMRRKRGRWGFKLQPERAGREETSGQEAGFV